METPIQGIPLPWLAEDSDAHDILAPESLSQIQLHDPGTVDKRRDFRGLDAARGKFLFRALRFVQTDIIPPDHPDDVVWRLKTWVIEREAVNPASPEEELHRLGRLPGAEGLAHLSQAICSA